MESMIGRITARVVAGPVCCSVKLSTTELMIGSVATIPLRRGPRLSAMSVTDTTSSAVTLMRKGRSHRGDAGVRGGARTRGVSRSASSVEVPATPAACLSVTGSDCRPQLVAANAAIAKARQTDQCTREALQ
jgi:hypothetical protein